MADSIEERFRRAADSPAPDQWEEITRRTEMGPSVQPSRPVARRLVLGGAAAIGVVAVAAVVAVAVWGSDQDRLNTAAGPGGDADPELSCGEAVFPASALSNATGAETDDSIESEALRTFLQADTDEAPPASGYRTLVSSDDAVTFAAGAAPRLYVVTVPSNTAEASGGGWCETSIYRPGLERVSVRTATPDGPDSSSLVVELSELACADNDLADRLVPLEIDETASTISVSAFAQPPSEGPHLCIEHPPVTMTVTLDDPVGGRTIVDAGAYPPKRVGVRE